MDMHRQLSGEASPSSLPERNNLGVKGDLAEGVGSTSLSVACRKTSTSEVPLGMGVTRQKGKERKGFYR